MARRVGFALLMFACASLFIAVPPASGGGCHSAGAPTDDAVEGDEVRIADCSFGPSALQVDPGEKVTFTNTDYFDHTATGLDWSTDLLGRGDSATITFDEAGTFNYYCKLHPNMTGTIIVGDGEAAAAAPAPPASGDGALASGVGEDSGDGVSVFEVGIAILSGLVGFGLGRLTTLTRPLGANAVK